MNRLVEVTPPQSLLCARDPNVIPRLHAGVIGIINNSQWCADMFSLSPTSRR